MSGARPAPLAVVPVKLLGAALRRLSGMLATSERRALQLAMLEDVLTACAGSRLLEGTLVVTSDPGVVAVARAHGARVLADHVPPRGMNPAVAVGQAEAARRGRPALVLTGDLPLARSEDIDAIVAAAPPAPAATLAPSRDGTGTNAMLLAPAQALAPELGPGSLERHLAQARRVGVTLRVIERPRLALDVDTPADLVALWDSGAPGAARALCARWFAPAPTGSRS